MSYYATTLLLIIFICRKLDCGFHVTNPAHQCPKIVCMVVRFKRGMAEEGTAVPDSPATSTTLAPALLPISSMGC